MIKIHSNQEAAVLPVLESCRVCRVDSQNAVCMVDNPACVWATPFGNYCEHPQVQRIREYDPREDLEGSDPVLH